MGFMCCGDGWIGVYAASAVIYDTLGDVADRARVRSLCVDPVMCMHICLSHQTAHPSR